MTGDVTHAQRQTMEQYRIKAEAGWLDGFDVKFRYHWRFWQPLSAVGGRVYFGWYAEIEQRCDRQDARGVRQ